MEVKPATTTVNMADGRELSLVLTFPALYRLKSERPREYKEANRVLVKGAEEVLDYLQLMYTAYLCANLEQLDGCMSFRKFTELAPEINAVTQAVNELVAPKKRAASGRPFAKRPAREATAE